MPSELPPASDKVPSFTGLFSHPIHPAVLAFWHHETAMRNSDMDQEEEVSHPLFDAKNNHDAAIQLRDAAEVLSGLRLNLVPFGHFAPEAAQWWLVPGPKPANPAYPHSKVFLREVKTGPAIGSVYIGYYAEKGFDPSLTSMVAKKYLLQPGWYWHELVALASSSRLDTAVAGVGQRSGQPVVVSVSSSVANKPPDVEFHTGDEVTFVVSNVGQWKVETPPTSTLSPLVPTTSIHDLFERLGQIDLRFFWLNFRAGVRLRYGPGQATALSAEDVWQTVLAPWVPWLK